MLNKFPNPTYSPNLNSYKVATKTTPTKISPQINQSNVQHQLNTTIGTNRSSTSVSTASQYASLNATLSKQSENSTPSYLTNKYGAQPYVNNKTVANFEPINVPNYMYLDRGRISNQLQNRPSTNMTYSPTNISTDSVQAKTENYSHIYQNKPLSPISKRGIEDNLPQLNKVNQSLSSANIKQKYTSQHQPYTTQPSDDDFPYCINHPTKRSKYRMPNDLSVTFCSKCAVKMVGQGFKVEELAKPQEQGESIRRKDIESFLDHLGQQIPNMEVVLQALSTKKSEIKRYYEQQKNKIQSFFSFHIELLEQQRQKLEQKLSTCYQQANLLFETQLSSLQNSLTEAGDMQKDIEQNVERIIRQIELNPFKEIMSSYKRNLSSFANKIQDIQNIPVEIQKVNVPNIDICQDRYNIIYTQIANEIEFQSFKTSLLNNNLQSQQQPQNTCRTPTPFEKRFQPIEIVQPQGESMYISFDNREHFNPIQKKSPILSKNISQNDENKNTANNNLSPYDEKVPGSIKVAKVNLYDVKQETKKPPPFKQLFQDQPHQKAEKLEKEPQKIEESFEEGHSQMIEKEDIENNYNLMLCENESEQEEIQQHILEMEKTKQQGGIQLFCSPQFKDH